MKHTTLLLGLLLLSILTGCGETINPTPIQQNNQFPTSSNSSSQQPNQSPTQPNSQPQQNNTTSLNGIWQSTATDVTEFLQFEPTGMVYLNVDVENDGIVDVSEIGNYEIVSASELTMSFDKDINNPAHFYNGTYTYTIDNDTLSLKLGSSSPMQYRKAKK
jgi:hypothetical protein